jgi:hypothetical protein
MLLDQANSESSIRQLPPDPVKPPDRRAIEPAFSSSRQGEFLPDPPD